MGIEGHYHIPKRRTLVEGDTIFVHDRSGTGGRWKVEITSIFGFPTARYSQVMIRQDKRDVTGAEFQGVCVARVR